MINEAEHAAMRATASELIEGTYGRPPKRIDRVLEGGKACSCNVARSGGVRMMYDKGELIWWFDYCHICNVAWYVTPLGREDMSRMPSACKAAFGERFGGMVAHEVLVHDKTGQVCAAHTVYEEK